MKIYQADQNKWGRSVKIIENSDFIWLDPRPSQKLINHSPDGFSWGYSGSGPAQLALAILYDVLGFEKKDLALRYYQKFKENFVAGFAPEGFMLPEELVLYWLQEVEKVDAKL